jgi:hypothetical protein
VAQSGTPADKPAHPRSRHALPEPMDVKRGSWTANKLKLMDEKFKRAMSAEKINKQNKNK